MGAVELNVRDMEAMERFYTSVIGLEILQKEEGVLLLGMRSIPIVTLHYTPDLETAFPGDAGLYHLAIVFSSRGALVEALKRVFEKAPHLFSGSADHLVSEAFYLSDPEGNGLELYYDRDPSAWQWENGLVKMASIYISPQEYIRLHSSGKTEVASAKIGHVHLKVGSVEKAREFYVDIVGFSITALMPSALFVSIGGYHHHLGMNTWESEVATERRESLGLRSFECILQNSEQLDSLVARLEKAGVSFQKIDEGIEFYDPWRNRLRFRVGST